MTVDDIIKECKEVIKNKIGQHISLVMPGKWGKSDKRRLCSGGPIGSIVGDSFRDLGVIVLFDAEEVLKFLLRRRERGKKMGKSGKIGRLGGEDESIN